MTDAVKSSHFTVIGSAGFIGSHLVRHLTEAGHDVDAWDRLPQSPPDRSLQNVLYCAGLTADFRQRPYDTVEAHVSTLAVLLRDFAFENLTYLSSARVYCNSTDTRENAALSVNPSVSSDLYNLTKLTGEALCLESGRPTKIVRLTNVYGRGEPPTNFLPSIIAEAKRQGKVEFQTSPESSKDFIAIADVVQLLTSITLQGHHRIYNLGRGKNVTNEEIAQKLRELGVDVTYCKASPTWKLPEIDTKLVDSEFAGSRKELVDDLELLYRTSIQE